MRISFKEWIEKKSGITIWPYSLNPKNELAALYNYGILHKAKDAINREGEWEIIIDKYGVRIAIEHIVFKGFRINNNNSEQETLKKALEYIYEHRES